MLKSSLFSFILFITACTTLPEVKQLPPQADKVKTFQVETKGQSSLLFVQFAENQWRWIQTDPLGAPIARVLLTPNGWQQDGFVMPNRQAQQLFTALANALNPENPPFQLDKRWSIEQQPTHFFIALPDGTQWTVKTLEQSP